VLDIIWKNIFFGFLEFFILFTNFAISNCDLVFFFSCMLVFWCTIWIFFFIFVISFCEFNTI
jgi:hypothetical protein